VSAADPGDRLMRLWTPYRMAYITGESGGPVDGECPFCVIPGGSDEDGLVVARGELCYVMLNLHPYNPGHLMVLPYRHVGELDDLTPPERAEVMELTSTAVGVIRDVARPHAFNIGINLGATAGGSLADHIHQHVVPRWGGDANFITVLGGTKILPQLLEDTRELLAGAWPT
jgi:ATP adenylyltransferase